MEGSTIAPAAAAARLSMRHTDCLNLGRRELTVLLQDSPATDTGVQYSLPDIVAMRKCDLVRVLESVGQAVNKQRPTRLELLGGVVTLLCDMGRLEL